MFLYFVNITLSKTSQFFSTIKINERQLIKILIASLCQVTLRLHICCFRLVELCDISFTLFILSCNKAESIACTCLCKRAALQFLLRSNGIVIYLLYFFVKSFLCCIESQLLVLIVYTSRANSIACLETIEIRLSPRY